MAGELREKIQEALKAAMRAHETLRVSTLRMMIARLKELDIAARPKGVAAVPDEEIVVMLRSMVKSRRESEALYRRGNRPDLADKENEEIAIIDSFLPQTLGGAALESAIAVAIRETGAASVKDMGKVMAVLKASYGSALDMAATSALIKVKLAS